jgi:hypothetical protein
LPTKSEDDGPLVVAEHSTAGGSVVRAVEAAGATHSCWSYSGDRCLDIWVGRHGALSCHRPLGAP